MKEPILFELKKWLTSRTITGLKLHRVKVSDELAYTDYELLTGGGESRRVRESTLKPLVDLSPDGNTVLRPVLNVRQEVRDWEEFSEKHVAELQEYERLKAKFGGEE